MYPGITVQMGYADQIQLFVMDGMTALMELMRLVVVRTNYIAALYYYAIFSIVLDEYIC